MVIEEESGEEGLVDLPSRVVGGSLVQRMRIFGQIDGQAKKFGSSVEVSLHFGQPRRQAAALAGDVAEALLKLLL